MADNTTLNLGSGGDVIATDDISGVKYQRVKVSVGADGSAADASLTAPLPVRLSDGSAAISTLPVSLASVPSHAVTNAGTFAVQVTSIAAGTNNIGDVDVLSVVPGTAATSLGKAEDAAHASGDTGVMMLAVRQDSDATMASATGDYTPLQCDATGYLKVNVKAGSGAGTSSTDDAAFTAGSGTGTPMMGFATSDAVDSGDVGVVAMTTTRSLKTVVTNSSGTVIDPQVDDAAFTAGTSLVSVIGGISTSDSVDSGDAGAFAMTTARALHTVLKTDTAGGTTIFRTLDLDEADQQVKATAGQIYWIHAMNLAASKRYLKIYNATAASVTVGTTTPVLTFVLPTQGDTNGAGFFLSVPNGISFGTAITVACTTGLADNDTGAPGANEVVLNLGYA